MQDGTWRAKIDTSRAKQAMFPAEAAMGGGRGFSFSWIRELCSSEALSEEVGRGKCLRASDTTGQFMMNFFFIKFMMNFGEAMACKSLVDG
jgi:hypothetical protein